MNRRQWTIQTSAALGAATFASMSSQAQGVSPVEGKQFTRLGTPVPTSNPGKIEVIEVFGYFCGHCYKLEPSVQAWMKSLPPDVAFRRVPATGSPAVDQLAKVFYTLEAMGQLGRLHAKVFDAFHKDGEHFTTPDAAGAWASRQGLDRAQFLTHFKSLGVQTKVRMAGQVPKIINVTSVPVLVVDGRFITDATMAGSYDAVMPTIDQMVAKIRKKQL